MNPISQPTATERELSRLEPLLANFEVAVGALDKDDKRLSLGVDALLAIHQQLGDEGIRDLIRWAVHPTSGFLISMHNPLPQNLNELLRHKAFQINDAINEKSRDPEFIKQVQETRKQVQDAPLTRRDFLSYGKSAVNGALGFTILARIVERNKAEDRQDIIAMGVLCGAIAGVMVKHTSQRLVDILAENSVSEPKAIGVRIDPTPSYFNEFKVAEAAALALEKLLYRDKNPEQESGITL